MSCFDLLHHKAHPFSFLFFPRNICYRTWPHFPNKRTSCMLRVIPKLVSPGFWRDKFSGHLKYSFIFLAHPHTRREKVGFKSLAALCPHLLHLYWSVEFSSLIRYLFRNFVRNILVIRKCGWAAVLAFLSLRAAELVFFETWAAAGSILVLGHGKR
jgi:hypothetical protein